MQTDCREERWRSEVSRHVSVRRVEGATVVRCADTVDSLNFPAVVAELCEVVRQTRPKRLLLDMSATAFLQTAALTRLSTLNETVRRNGGELTLCGVPANLAGRLSLLCSEHGLMVRADEAETLHAWERADASVESSGSDTVTIVTTPAAPRRSTALPKPAPVGVAQRMGGQIVGGLLTLVAVLTVYSRWAILVAVAGLSVWYVTQGRRTEQAQAVCASLYSEWKDLEAAGAPDEERQQFATRVRTDLGPLIATLAGRGDSRSEAESHLLQAATRLLELVKLPAAADEVEQQFVQHMRQAEQPAR